MLVLSLRKSNIQKKGNILFMISLQTLNQSCSPFTHQHYDTGYVVYYMCIEIHSNVWYFLYTYENLNLTYWVVREQHICEKCMENDKPSTIIMLVHIINEKMLYHKKYITVRCCSDKIAPKLIRVNRWRMVTWRSRRFGVKTPSLNRNIEVIAKRRNTSRLFVSRCDSLNAP